MRCNPLTGIKLRDVELAPSTLAPTAPAIFAKELTLSLSGHLRALFLRRPLKLDVFLNDAVIKVSQVVVDGPKGLPVGQWDPGVNTIVARDNEGVAVDWDVVAHLLRYLQPGTLSIRNSTVFLQPAKFLDYGHGDEIVKIDHTSARMTFPQFKVASHGSRLPFEMNGDFRTEAKGSPLGGGSIEVECTLNGNILSSLKPEDPFVSLHVKGNAVEARRVASFLSLPFRADQGLCAADINMDFLYKSSSLVPIMSGEVMLQGVGLRFHPDPKTPEMSGIDGKLTFEGKTMFLEGPVGSLGKLPMTVVGSIHLEDGYNLMGYVRPIDVNDVIETFDVDKFVPVVGLVSGEAQLSGPLEEPIITGWAESVTENNMFDRLPLKSANLDFEWDAIAGILEFSEIYAAVKGGGLVHGSGALYFDMTKESPYGISQKTHSPRSPKAAYWNLSSERAEVPVLQPLPDDELEIDEQAPYRPYDSMRFDFKAVDISGGDLLYYYGGEYGKMAIKAIGLVSGEAVLAGHAEDANCRAVWRSTTPPPPVSLGPNAHEESQSEVGRTIERVASIEVPKEEAEENVRDGSSEHKGVLHDQLQSLDNAEKGENMLGGGVFKGFVYIKLGDLPEARRLKARTTVKDFDARRAGWSDPGLRKALAHAPLLNVSVDAYFKGTTAQRAVLPSGVFRVPRTPVMELLAADGALAVKDLSINNVKFDKVMSGSFSFSTSDFSLSLREIKKKNENQNGRGRKSDDRAMDRSGDTDLNESDELRVTASLKGDGDFCFRLGDAEIVALLTKDEQRNQIGSLFARNVVIDDFLGNDRFFSSGETLGGILNMNMKLDLTSQRGNGNLSLLRPRVGPMSFTTVVGNLKWRERDLILERGIVKYRRSEYHIDARYHAKSQRKPEFEWEVNVNIPLASIGDVASLVQSGNAVATAMQSPSDKIRTGRLRYSGGPLWIQRLSESSVRTRTFVEEWKVPEHLSLADQIRWFNQYLEDKENIRKLKAVSLEHAIFDSRQTDIAGDISGRVSLKYNSRSGETRSAPSSASAVLKAVLDQLTRSTFSFEFGGSNWRIGHALLDRVEGSGTFEDGILLVGPLSLKGKDGFGAEAQGRITGAGSVNGFAILQKAPAALVKQFSRAPVNVTGVCNGRLEVEGNLSNPRAFGRVVWTDATLNGKQVRGAKTDMACVNGRCILNVNARIGGRKRSSEDESDETGIRSLQWGESVIAGLRDLASQVSSKGESTELVQTKVDRQMSGEAMQVRISAPVRFYLLNYLQKRAPTSFWSAIEPVLGGSLPSDDEWVSIDVNVKKYGLILLNTVLPELGWESGDSDIRMRVSGTLNDPVARGVVTVSDGRASPSVLVDSVQGLRGEIEFNEKGLISLKSITGRCGGRNVNVNGDLFFSDEHRKRLSTKLFGTHTVLERLHSKNASGRRERAQLMQRENELKTILTKGRKGINIEFGDVGIKVPNMIASKMSGKLQLLGTAVSPVLRGGIAFSEGVISVGNMGGLGNGGGSGTEIFNGKVKGMQDATRKRILSSTTARKSGVKWENENTELSRGKGGAESSDKDKRNEGEHLTEQDAGVEKMESRKLSDGFGGVRMDKVRVTLGKEMHAVQPFMINLETQGSVTLDGTGTETEVEGEIRMVRGSINMLTTRMSVSRDERNYIRFVGKDGGGEPIMRMTLEDGDLLVRIGECGISRWKDHVVVADKSGDVWTEEKWGQVVESNLESITSKEKVGRLLAGYVMKNVEGRGNIGKFEWKVFPSLVSGSGGYEEGKLRDELGVGGEFEWNWMTVGGRRSIDGSVGGNVRLKGEWGGIGLDLEGMKQSFSIELKVPEKWISRRGRKDKALGNEQEKETKMKQSAQKGSASDTSHSPEVEPEMRADDDSQ